MSLRFAVSVSLSPLYRIFNTALYFCFLHFVSKDDGHFMQAFHVVGSCLPTIIIK